MGGAWVPMGKSDYRIGRDMSTRKWCQITSKEETCLLANGARLTQRKRHVYSQMVPD
jgi:hypothetical protein